MTGARAHDLPPTGGLATTPAEAMALLNEAAPLFSLQSYLAAHLATQSSGFRELFVWLMFDGRLEYAQLMLDAYRIRTEPIEEALEHGGWRLARHVNELAIFVHEPRAT